jgi:hypothetical protein
MQTDLPMRPIITLSLLVCTVLVACAVPPPIVIKTGTPLELASGQPVQVMGLGPMVARLDASEAMLNVQYGWFCEPASRRRLPSDFVPFSRGDLQGAIQGALEPLGYKFKSAPDSVFKREAPAPLLLGGTVTKVRVNTCHPFSGRPSLDVGNPTVVKGNAFLEVTWELFSSGDQKVVYKSSSQGSFATESTISGGASAILLNALKENLRNLAADPSFRDAVLKALPSTESAPSMIKSI